MDPFEDVLDEQQKLITQGAGMEQIVANLHTSGMTMLDAVKGVRTLYNLSLREAQRIVREHPAWAEEARNVLSLNYVASIIVQDPAYFSWIEWFSSGANGMGMVQITSPQDRQWETNIGMWLRKAATEDKQTQHLLIEDLVSQTNHFDEISRALIAIIGTYQAYEAPVVELACEVLSIPRFSQNIEAIRWLVNLAAHEYAPGRSQAIQILQTLDMEAVVPYFLAALINTNDTSLSWKRMVSGICGIIREKREWAHACGPVVAYLLGQHTHEQENEAELAAFLAVLDCIHPNDTYAIPVLYHLAFQKHGTVIGQRIRDHLLSYDAEAIKYYVYHLRWLIE